MNSLSASTRHRKSELHLLCHWQKVRSLFYCTYQQSHPPYAQIQAPNCKRLKIAFVRECAGVLQVEAMAQLAGIVMLDPSDEAAKGLFFFGGIDNCRFRRPVVPGDTLMMRVEVTKYNKRFGIVKVDAKGYVGDALAVDAELTLAMAKQ